MREKFDDIFFPHDVTLHASLSYEYDGESGVYTITVESIAGEDHIEKSVSNDHVYVNLHFGETPETEQDTRNYIVVDLLKGEEIIVKNVTDYNATERGPNEIINISININSSTMTTMR